MRPLLHDYWRSSACYRVRIALNLKAIAYDTKVVDLLRQDHLSDAHRAINPQASVPALAIDGLLLTQSMAILEYLEETRPAVPLLPTDPAGRARVRQLCHVIAMDIHPICNAPVAAHAGALSGNPEGNINWMNHYMEKGLAAFETLLMNSATGRFCHGNQPTLADCLLVPQLYNAERWGANIAKLQRIRLIAERARDLPAFRRAAPETVGAPT